MGMRERQLSRDYLNLSITAGLPEGIDVMSFVKERLLVLVLRHCSRLVPQHCREFVKRRGTLIVRFRAR